MSQRELDVLEQKDIQVGDYVSLPWRGGTAGGIVKEIALSETETPHPPKVRQLQCAIGLIQRTL